MWWKLVIMMEVSHCNNLNHCNWTLSLWWTFITLVKKILISVMKIHNPDEKSSLGWKFTLVEINKRKGINDWEKYFLHVDYYILGSLEFNSNMITILKWTKIHHSEENLARQIWIWDLHIKPINFAFLSSVAFGHYLYFPG